MRNQTQHIDILESLYYLFRASVSAHRELIRSGFDEISAISMRMFGRIPRPITRSDVAGKPFGLGKEAQE
jgi:hypothetical protein